MPLLSYAGLEFMWFVVAVLTVLLIGGALRSAFRDDDAASREDQPRPDTSRYVGIGLGLALSLSGALIWLYGLFRWPIAAIRKTAVPGPRTRC